MSGKLVLVSESLKGEHHRVSSPFVFQVATQGSKAIRYTRNGYELSRSFRQVLDGLKPQAVLVGTDLDHQGTKIGTVIADYCRSKGIPVYRYALTENGYAKTGRFYTEKEMKACHAVDTLNIETAAFFKRRWGVSISAKKASLVAAGIALRAVGKFTVKQTGTNTITAYTKGMMRGKPISAVRKKLHKLYASGAIDYPRVDGDYEPAPLQVYAHPPLTAKGYTDEDISPFEVSELPACKETCLLYFRRLGLTTPATAERDFNFIDEFFNNDFTVKEQYSAMLQDMLAVSRETADLYAELVRIQSPNADLFDAPPLPGSSRELDDFLESMEGIRKRQEEHSFFLSRRRSNGGEHGYDFSP